MKKDEMTYAQIAEKLFKLEKKFEKKALEASTAAEKNSAKRMLERVKSRIAALKEENQAAAMPEETPGMYGKGGKVPMYLTGGEVPLDLLVQGGSMLGSSVDNMAAAKMIRELQGPVAPEEFVAPVLDTEFDIRPQLVEADRNYRSAVRGINTSTTDAGTARNARLVALGQVIGGKNSLMGEKNNRETALKNQQALITADIANKNTVNRNRYRNELADFENRKAGLRQKNAANIGQDMQDFGADYMDYKSQKDALGVLQQKYDYGGVLDQLAKDNPEIAALVQENPESIVKILETLLSKEQ